MNRKINKYFFYNPALIFTGEWLYRDLSFLKKSQFYSYDQIKEYQNYKLKKLVKFAKKESPYYKSRLPTNINIEDLQKISFIDKATVRNNAHALRTSKHHFCRQKTTGGSTGAAITISKNSGAMGAELAASWRGYGWAGINISDKQVRFWGIPQRSKRDRIKAFLIDFICNRYRVSAFGVDSKSMQTAIKKVVKFKPDYFYGYVSMIKEFAKHIKDDGKVGIINPKAIITTSEVLTEADRSYISNVFGCRVFNEYGCGEVNTIAHECEYGSLHINSESLIIEVIGDAGIPLPPGNAGEIVVTDLNNFAMPLIRYKLSDWGMVSPKMCSCGRGLPVIEKVYGRAYDSLINDAGKKFHGEFFLYIIEDAKKKQFASRRGAVCSRNK